MTFWSKLFLERGKLRHGEGQKIIQTHRGRMEPGPLMAHPESSSRLFRVTQHLGLPRTEGFPSTWDSVLKRGNSGKTRINWSQQFLPPSSLLRVDIPSDPPQEPRGWDRVQSHLSHHVWSLSSGHLFPGIQRWGYFCLPQCPCPWVTCAAAEGQHEKWASSWPWRLCC